MKWQLAVLVIFLVVVVLVASFWIFQGVKKAYYGWREDWVKMVAAILTSFVIGQAVFWLIGYDQLGIAMRPFFETGIGQAIGEKVTDRLPINETTAWTVKFLEVGTDAGRIWTEGETYLKYGICPDGLAAVVTQPLWSTIEVAEKVRGVAVNQEAMGTRDQIQLSISCIYGNLFRYLQVVIIWLTYIWIHRFIELPIEGAIRWIAELF